MKDWERKLDEFLAFNERRVLPDAGSVSKKAADNHARQEYDRFTERRREHKEALGEAESIKALEETARRLLDRGERE
ncbi:RhuM family protein [Desulfoscipio geothermicus]|nr:RhuM family protein [Desulfoscipio geothermicus]